MKAACFFSCCVAVLVAGCVSPTPFHQAPEIVDISDTKVIVERVHGDRPATIWARENTATMQEVEQEAARGCSQYNKTPELMGKNCGLMMLGAFGKLTCISTNYVFSCVDQ